MSPKMFKILAGGLAVLLLLGATFLFTTRKSTDEEIRGLLLEAQIAGGNISILWENRLKGIESRGITARQKYAIQNLRDLVREYTERTHGEESHETVILGSAVETYLSGEKPLPRPTLPPPKPTNAPTPTYAPYPSDARVYAKKFVLDHLRAPSTAKFPWGSEFSVSDLGNIWIVESYVDAQNGFGAMIRTRFIVKMEYLGAAGWKLLDLQMR